MSRAVTLDHAIMMALKFMTFVPNLVHRSTVPTVLDRRRVRRINKARHLDNAMSVFDFIGRA
jgi:hypothetical protein